MQRKNIGRIFTKNLLITEILLVLIIIILGAFTFHYIEGWRILDAFYFIVCTMSTIGFGDYAPQTDIGKIFVMFYAFFGVPFFVSIGGLFLESRFRKTVEHYLKRVYRELHDAELEIEAVEETVIRRLKKPLENKQESVNNLQEEIEQTEKKSRWKKILRK